MKKLFYVLWLCATPLIAQVQYGRPAPEDLPEALKKYPGSFQVNHFPNEVHPVKIEEKYYWKHNTAVLSPGEKRRLLNLGRISTTITMEPSKEVCAQEFDELFGAKKRKLLAAQPTPGTTTGE